MFASTKLIVVKDLILRKGISLIQDSTSYYNCVNQSISISTKEIEELSNNLGISSEEVELYITLHEYSHSLQPDWLLISSNVLYRERDAWDRAEELYRKLWGDIPHSFYIVRNKALDSYTNADPYAALASLFR